MDVLINTILSKSMLAVAIISYKKFIARVFLTQEASQRAFSYLLL